MVILLVDDEPLIHLSIEKWMQACEPEHIICHAYNGNQMLAMLGERQVDLALVDIKMPGPSGLEAIALAREVSPQTRYYIMSGFDEFEYAKQAVKLKVDDYLMKPLDLKTIREVLAAAEQHAAAERQRRADSFRNWLECALNGREHPLGELDSYHCGLIVLTMDNASYGPGNVANLFVPYRDRVATVSQSDSLLVLCYDKKAEELEELYRSLAATTLPEGVTGFMSPVTNRADRRYQLLEALRAGASLRPLLQLGCWYPIAQLHAFGELQTEFCTGCQKWRQAYLAKDFTAFSSQSELLVTQLFRHRELHQYCVQVCRFFAATLGCTDPLPTEAAPLRQQLELAARGLVSAPSQDSKAQQLIRFIQEHYHQNISAAELSQRFGLSTNHIGNLLKGTLGLRYNDYLTQLRMSRAKELLLSTQLSVKEITAACGYFSQSHFIKLFVEREGCTPSEYRKAQTG